LISEKLPVVALTVFACAVPVTLKLVRPDKFVILAVVKLPVVALMVAACAVPVTVKPLKLPTEVILGCAGVVSVPLI